MESQSEVTSGLYRMLNRLCEGCWSASKVVCIPNGVEHRFIIRIEPAWRPRVYAYLAKHTNILIPADGGPLNLSIEEALSLGRLETTHAMEPHLSEEVVPGPLPPRTLPTGLAQDGLEHTLQ